MNNMEKQGSPVMPFSTISNRNHGPAG